MQFRVPQFIDIEDKILGPLTWKQFAYTLGAGGSAYMALRFTDSKFLGILIGIPFVSLFLSLAFVKINNQTFVEVLEHAFNYISRGNLYTWQKDDKRVNDAEQIVVEENKNKVQIINVNKQSLREIANDLDIKNNKERLE